VTVSRLTRAVGAPVERIDGPAKVTGTARYALEHPLGPPVYLHAVQARIARGRVASIGTADATALPGVLAVLTHRNAPRLASDEDRELWVLQDDEVSFRGQYVAAALADSSEVAREAAGRVGIEYEEWSHAAELSAERSDLYEPEKLNAGYPTETAEGDVDAALASAAVTVDETYTTPTEHNNPLEPHATVALWEDGGLTLYDSTQGAHSVRSALAPLFGLDPAQVRVISPHVGGGFGSKGLPHANVVLTALAARTVEGRPVKYALSRREMFSLAGYRTPTIQRIRLGTDRDGRLSAVGCDVVEQTSRIKEYAEQTGLPARMMYAAPNRRTTHRLAALDVPVPSWMRAPGGCPGMFALEVAMDELAFVCGLDPIELRVRNEPELDPDSGLPWSSRNLVACLREGAHRFGWDGRDRTPKARRAGTRLIGTGVASSAHPVVRMPGSAATIQLRSDGRYAVRIGAADLGTGTWTALTQIAADALEVPFEMVALEIGDTELPPASVAGGSSGITSWGSTVIAAARAFRDEHGSTPSEGAEATAEMPDNPDAEHMAMYAFGAQFAEVTVDADTGTIRVPRMLAVFASGRIVNPRTARSQFIGGMTMGLSMALHEEGIMDPRFGHVVNQDLAEYHIAANADVESIEAHWLEEDDPHVNPLGTKGIGEIGIVGAAAAIANAAHHATGVRVRDLPITPDKLLGSFC
jgi:xanthine dehydrogenase YagR molybdenum-binding subunit